MLCRADALLKRPACASEPVRFSMNGITGREGRGVTDDGVSRRKVWSQGLALMRLVKAH
jgi:hypothetical protein